MAACGLEASAFRTVPLEILLRITDYLPTPDLGAFRLSCRGIHAFLDHAFIREFFERKQFMLTVFSLSVLVDISQSRLGPHLRFLHIGLDQLASEPLHSHTQAPATQPHHLQHYSGLLVEERLARAIGHHQELLATALKNLPNLESIIIRDHNSQRRTRDGWNAEWRSYGYNTLVNTTTFFPIMSTRERRHQDTSGASDVFAHLLYACAQSGARPKGIEMITQRIPVKGRAFLIHPSIMQNSVTSVIENLQKLHINFLPTWRDDGGPKLPKPGLDLSISDSMAPGHLNDEDYLLYRFLCKARNLTDLRLNQAHSPVRDTNNPAHYLLEWLAAAATSPSEPILTKLQNLSLGRSTVKASVLLKLIRAFAGTLQSLEMWRITLYRPLPGLEQGSVNEAWPKDSFWPSFLRDLRSIPNLNLHHIKIALMGQNFLHSNNVLGPLCQVGIGAIRQPIDYTGSDWRKHLEEKGKEVEVRWEPEYERRDDHLDVTSDESDSSEED